MGELLSKNERARLVAELRGLQRRRGADRVRVILHLDDGLSYAAAARALFLDETTAAEWKKRYEEGGLERLLYDAHQGRAALLSEAQQNELAQLLEQKIYSRTSDVVKLVKEQFGVTFSRSAMTAQLHRLGYSYKKPTAAPAKADAEKQKKFIKSYKRLRKKRRVYFLDSAHPTLTTSLAHGWIRRGETRLVKKGAGKQRANINGALCIETMDIITRSTKTTNKEAICDLLRAIRRKNEGEKIAVVMDNASYNKSKKVRLLAKDLSIRLVFLPPYSPNLNPIERLWKFMYAKVFANTFLASFKDYRKKLTAFFRRLIPDFGDELKTLLTDNFSPIQA